MNPYPKLMSNDPADIKDWCDNITKQRLDDVNEFQGIPDTYIAGRRGRRVPSSSSDVIIKQDFPGDMILSGGFVYFCILTGTTVSWVRASVGTF